MDHLTRLEMNDVALHKAESVGFLQGLGGTREDMNELYNDISDSYELLIGKGAGRIPAWQNDLIEIRKDVIAAARYFHDVSPTNLKRLRKMHNRDMPVLDRMADELPGFIEKGQQLPPIPGVELPTIIEILEQDTPPAIPGLGPPSDSDPVVPPMPPSPPLRVNWWVIGGIAAGLAVLTLAMSRPRGGPR